MLEVKGRVKMKISKRYFSVAFGFLCMLGLVGISVFEVRSSCVKTPPKKAAQSKSSPKRANEKSIVVPQGSNMSADRVDDGHEVTLKEALIIKGMKTLVPKYLPNGAKLEIVRAIPGPPQTKAVTVQQHYTMGDDWFDINAVAWPVKPDYGELGSPAKVLTVKGVRCFCGESLEDKGTNTFVEEHGRITRMVSTHGKDFRDIIFWKDGTQYYIGGFNVSRGDLKKMMASMLE